MFLTNVLIYILPQECDVKLINAKDEFLMHVGKRNVAAVVLKYFDLSVPLGSSGMRCFNHKYTEFYLPKNYSPDKYSQFLRDIDFLYCNTDLKQHIDGMILFTDRSYAQRSWLKYQWRGICPNEQWKDMPFLLY